MEAKQCPDGSWVGRIGPRCEFAPCPSQPISATHIFSITPNSGVVGIEVTISGRGFTDDNTIVFGGNRIEHVPVASSITIACTTDPTCVPGIRETLRFTVPEFLNPPCYYSRPACLMASRQTMPGPYDVYVQNAQGTSNTVVFTVAAGSSGGGISINGIDAPTTIPLGQTGAWSVHATLSGASVIHYSVVWGDEIAYPMILQPAEIPIQTSATFTHAYQRSGTYTPTFTVSDDAGHSASVSASVVVSPLY
jgi:hypothetical protein